MLLADDDVIEHVDLEELARPDEVARNFDVGLGWSRVTAGMVVNQHDCGPCDCDDRAEDLEGAKGSVLEK